jgi:hypothetical protein
VLKEQSGRGSAYVIVALPDGRPRVWFGKMTIAKGSQSHVFEVQVRPATDCHPSGSVLISDLSGQIDYPNSDTRLISALAIYANGASWDLPNGGSISYDAARISLTHRPHMGAGHHRSRCFHPRLPAGFFKRHPSLAGSLLVRCLLRVSGCALAGDVRASR